MVVGVKSAEVVGRVVQLIAKDFFVTATAQPKLGTTQRKGRKGRRRAERTARHQADSNT